jgi:hypothetical protein
MNQKNSEETGVTLDYLPLNVQLTLDTKPYTSSVSIRSYATTIYATLTPMLEATVIQGKPARLSRTRGIAFAI